MKEGEFGVLVQEFGDVFSLTNHLNMDDELYDIVEAHLNKKGCTLVKIHGTEPERREICRC